jgi:photosystem II stability/assembly factor-like uncharacterized protein
MSRRLSAFIGLSLVLAISSPILAAGSDPLDQPAKASRHMLQSLRTAVARAGNRLVSVGQAGIILLSDDNGLSWRQARQVPVSVLLTNVVFVSEKRGWAIGHGGVVLISDDGGENWRKQLDGAQAAAIELEAAKTDTGPNAKHRLSEAQGLVSDGADKPLLGLYFNDENHGIVIGAYGLALATEDGGESWHSLMGGTDNPRGKHLYALAATSRGLFIAGEEGSVFRSTDGGKSFKALKTPSRGTFFGLIASKSEDLVAFGLRGDAYRSADDGEHWDKLDLPSSGLNGGTRLADGSLVIVDDWGDVLLSRDDGRTFARHGAAQPMGLIGVTEANDGSLAAAGSGGDLRVSLKDDAVEPAK